MSGATGAGSTGTDTDGGGRGSAANATDPHTTQLRAIDVKKTDSHAPDTHGSPGGTVTDTRGPQAQQQSAGAGPAAPGAKAPTQGQAPAQPAAPPTASPLPGSPLPGERQPQQAAGPYHPPQACPTPSPAAAQSGTVRLPRTGARTTPRTRKARLRVAKADPWSVMKVSFLLSIALGVVHGHRCGGAVDGHGLDGRLSTVAGRSARRRARTSERLRPAVVPLAAARPDCSRASSRSSTWSSPRPSATLGAFIYNLSAGFVGGVELTLAEDE